MKKTWLGPACRDFHAKNYRKKNERLLNIDEYSDYYETNCILYDDKCIGEYNCLSLSSYIAKLIVNDRLDQHDPNGRLMSVHCNNLNEK